MIPLTFLYDEYIDRPKFTEQKKKKPIWVYSSFPHKWGRNNKKALVKSKQTHFCQVTWIATYGSRN